MTEERFTLTDEELEAVVRLNRDKIVRLVQYGVLSLTPTSNRDYNVGDSNYSEHLLQPWSIWLDYPELTEFDKDIIKRTLRTKKTDSRRLDYEKIKHICDERLRQLSCGLK